jgi:cytochrome c oxidase cbb3-type subunit 3
MSQSTKNPNDPKKQGRHNFDGIQEDDNDMPKWWVNLFIITIVFSALYMAWYHLPMFAAKSLEAEYQEAAEKDAENKATEVATQLATNPGDGFDYREALEKAEIVASGRDAYQTTCAACHGVDGGGTVGPNLTDKYWLNGGSFASIEKTISEGVAEKGMPGWGPVLGNEKVRDVAVFVMSLKGTTPAAPKEPQGIEFVEQPEGEEHLEEQDDE